MKQICSLLVVLLSSSLCLASSGELTLKGSWSFNVGETTVRVTGEELSNESESETSGSILLNLYLMKTKYSGSSLEGVKIFSSSFSPLDWGTYYSNIDRVQDMPAVDAGTYYVTLVVCEYIDGQYQIVDYLNFDATCTISSNPRVTTPTLEGTWTVSIPRNANNQYELKIDGGVIANTTSAATDSMKLMVLASAEPFDGKQMNGYNVYEFKLAPLAAGLAYLDNHDQLVLEKYPPQGTYHVALLLYSKERGSYYLVSYINLSGMVVVK